MFNNIIFIIKVIGIISIVIYIINITYINNNLHNQLRLSELQKITLQNDKSNLEKLLEEQNSYINTFKIKVEETKNIINKNKQQIQNKYDKKTKQYLNNYNITNNDNKLRIIDEMLYEFSNNI